MATTGLKLDRTQYVKVVDSTTDNFLISNNGGHSVRIAFTVGDVQPDADTIAYHDIEPGDDASRFATGKVWLLGRTTVGIDLI